MAQAAEEASKSTLQDLVLRSIKRTYDMFSSDGTAVLPSFLPSQKVKVAVRVNADYSFPKKPETKPTEEAGEAGGDRKPSETTKIIQSLEQEKEEKFLKQPLSSAGASSSTSLVTYKQGPGGALIVAPGAQGGGAAAAPGGPTTTLALRREPPKVPKPKWHAPWKLHAVVAGHLGWVRCLAFDPSNEWFVTGSVDRTIKVWDLAKCSAGAEGGLKLTLTGHISAIRGLAVSSRHPYLFSCGEDKMVKCWDLETNKVIRHYHGHLSGVYCLALHPTVDILVTGGRDSVARVWDMRTKHQIHCLSGHTNTVGAILTNSVEPQIITGSHDATVKLWDLAAGKSMSTLTNHKKSVRALAAHPTELTFVSGAQDNIKKWQTRDGKFLKNISGHNSVINALSVNEDGVMVSGADNGTLHFWDYETGYNFQKSETIVQPGSLDCEACIYASSFDVTGTRFLTCEADKTIKIWREDPSASEESHPIDMKGWTQFCLAPKRY